LWSAETQAWWPKGPADPDVRVLRVIRLVFIDETCTNTAMVR
jgi:general stress protein 26